MLDNVLCNFRPFGDKKLLSEAHNVVTWYPSGCIDKYVDFFNYLNPKKIESNNAMCEMKMVTNDATICVVMLGDLHPRISSILR